MNENAGPGPAPIAWWGFLIAAMFLVGYFAITVWLAPVFEPVQTHPTTLIPAVLLSAAASVLVGRRAAANLKAPQASDQRGGRTARAVSTEPGRPSHRRQRSRREVLRSASRVGLAGLTGCGLILAQVLPTSALEWVCLGGVAGSVAAAGHAWVVARHYESVETGLTD